MKYSHDPLAFVAQPIVVFVWPLTGFGTHARFGEHWTRRSLRENRDQYSWYGTVSALCDLSELHRGIDPALAWNSN